jgi:ubiquinone/menaquinone biosynthesis C-methylase UbiE
MMLFRTSADPHRLLVGMTGVQLGDRVLQIGCANGGRLAAIASKVGLSGRAVAVVPDDESAARATKSARRSGVLVEVEIASPTHLPTGDSSFDLVVIDDSAGLFASMRPEDRVATVREVLRVLRPGGRVMVVGSAPRGGLGALLSRGPGTPVFDAGPALKADGFRSARTLAEREGLIFVEGMRPRDSVPGSERRVE